MQARFKVQKEPEITHRVFLDVDIDGQHLGISNMKLRSKIKFIYLQMNLGLLLLLIFLFSFYVSQTYHCHDP